MTTNLNLHARLAVERVTDDVHGALVEFWRGAVPAADVLSAVKVLRAQSRATRTIAPREAEVVLGTAAAVEILVAAAEADLAANDLDGSDGRVQQAFSALDLMKGTLGI